MFSARKSAGWGGGWGWGGSKATCLTSYTGTARYIVLKTLILIYCCVVLPVVWVCVPEVAHLCVFLQPGPVRRIHTIGQRSGLLQVTITILFSPMTNFNICFTPLHVSESIIILYLKFLAVFINKIIWTPHYLYVFICSMIVIHVWGKLLYFSFEFLYTCVECIVCVLSWQ